MSSTKLMKRMQFVGSYSFSQLLPGLFNLLFSIVIIRKYGTQTWGELVALQVIVQLALVVLNYGHKEFLLKAFSEKPSAVPSYFMLSLGTRSVLLIAVISLSSFFLPLDSYLKMTLCVWILARYVISAFDSYIIFTKAFKTAILTELFTSSLLLGALIFTINLSFGHILFLFSAAYLLKALINIFLFRLLFREAQFSVNISLLQISFPFAALSVTGFLQSRADLVVLSVLMSSEMLAQYHVLTTFLLLMHGIPGFIVSPFVNNLYRGDSKLVQKVKFNVILAGLFISAAGILLLYFALPLIYDFTFEDLIYILAFFYVFSTYLFYVDIYRFYKLGKVREVLIISVCSAMANIAACFALIPHFGMAGAMAANLFAQLLLWLFFSVGIRPGNPNTRNPQD